ncbi:hypothetical protein AYO21_02068 [Fonsecaea monophora]|uniref:Uncharacterized protein n=1 Tax=Fonsecaea monophora TaxID=254056 RepID=A0A177FJB0_9EURO|nr:hypothetical protein AYO21_02068 [Fonsecaea monophora]OAG43841.1 hypothetical protein AYO21_02068 [Fonsecaea monophora]
MAPQAPSKEAVRAGKTAAQEQIPNLAFNLFGKAMEDKCTERDKHQVIVARNASTTSWSDVIEKNKEDTATAEQPIFRPSMDFTMREQDTKAPQVGTGQFLVVGYAKANLDKKYRSQDPGVTKQIVGVFKPNEILPWEDDKHPTSYVVTPILDFSPEQLKLYVLLKPDKGLCTPYSLAKDDVFFRFEYRDTEPNVSKRRTSWRKNISQHSVRVGLQMKPSAKQEAFKRALNVGKVIVDSHEDCGNEMKVLMMAFKKSHDDWLLQEMKRLMRRINVDIAYRPLQSKPALQSFVDNDTVDFTNEWAAGVVQEVSGLWPDVQDMTAERVIILQRLMHEQGAEIKNFQLKGLLAEGMYRLKQQANIENIMDEEGFVKDLVSTLDRTLGKEAQPKPTASNMDEQSQDALLAAVGAKLQSILDYYYSFSAKLNSQFGDHVLEGAGPADFWVKYAEAPDTDSARLAFNHVAKFLVAEFTHVLGEGVVKPVHNIVEILGRLDLSPS